MNRDDIDFDWAASALSVELCDSTDLSKLIDAADLDPFAGDVSDIDFSNMDLRNQNMSGWDLKNASFTNARIANANLKKSKINPEAIIDADDWFQAEMDSDLRTNAIFAAVRRFPLNKLEISISTFNFINDLKLRTIGDLMGLNELEMSKSKVGGKKNILELKEALGPFRVSLMEDKRDDRDSFGQHNPDLWFHIKSSDDVYMAEEILQHMEKLRNLVQKKPLRRRRPIPTSDN